MMTHDEERIGVLARYLPTHVVGAEIGVYKGNFTHHLLEVLLPRTLHLIDPWYLAGLEWDWAKGDRSTTNALAGLIQRFSNELVSGRVLLHIGRDFETLPTFPDETFDWVYLDTSHQYKKTLEELRLLRSKVKSDGFITGDDWRPDPAHRHHGVFRAVRQFVGEEPYEIVYASEADQQWIIRQSLRSGVPAEPDPQRH